MVSWAYRSCHCSRLTRYIGGRDATRSDSSWYVLLNYSPPEAALTYMTKLKKQWRSSVSRRSVLKMSVHIVADKPRILLSISRKRYCSESITELRSIAKPNPVRLSQRSYMALYCRSQFWKLRDTRDQTLYLLLCWTLCHSPLQDTINTWSQGGLRRSCSR